MVSAAVQFPGATMVLGAPSGGETGCVRRSREHHARLSPRLWRDVDGRAVKNIATILKIDELIAGRAGKAGGTNAQPLGGRPYSARTRASFAASAKVVMAISEEASPFIARWHARIASRC